MRGSLHYAVRYSRTAPVEMTVLLTGSKDLGHAGGYAMTTVFAFMNSRMPAAESSRP
jgi:hypothetical protein